jgi:hypothetical protein
MAAFEACRFIMELAYLRNICSEADEDLDNLIPFTPSTSSQQ